METGAHGGQRTHGMVRRGQAVHGIGPLGRPGARWASRGRCREATAPLGIEPAPALLIGSLARPSKRLLAFVVAAMHHTYTAIPLSRRMPPAIHKGPCSFSFPIYQVFGHFTRSLTSWLLMLLTNFFMTNPVAGACVVRISAPPSCTDFLN